jgi:hypothetical protein
MEINFSNVDLEKSFTLYDKGAYRVRIKSIEDVQASSGNDQLRIKTEIMTEPYEGKQLTDHITLVQACDWKVAKFLHACGIDVKALGTINTTSGTFRATLNKVVNKTTVWVVDQQTGRDGNLRNVVTDYQPDPDAKDEPEDTPEFLKEEVNWDEEK